MRASMPRGDRGEATLDERGRSSGSSRMAQQMPLHLRRVPRHQESCPAGTGLRASCQGADTSGIHRPAPRTRGSSGCPEGAPRRSAAAHARSRGGARTPPGPGIRQPATVARPMSAQRARPRPDNAPHRRRAAGRGLGRAEQVRLEFVAALVVTPLPIQTRPCAGLVSATLSRSPERAGGRNTRVSAASCQTKTRWPQPQPRYTWASAAPKASTPS